MYTFTDYLAAFRDACDQYILDLSDEPLPKEHHIYHTGIRDSIVKQLEDISDDIDMHINTGSFSSPVIQSMFNARASESAHAFLQLRIEEHEDMENIYESHPDEWDEDDITSSDFSGVNEAIGQGDELIDYANGQTQGDIDGWEKVLPDILKRYKSFLPRPPTYSN